MTYKKLTKSQAKEIAAFLCIKDIKSYIEAHQKEYERFLAKKQLERGEKNGKSKRSI